MLESIKNVFLSQPKKGEVSFEDISIGDKDVKKVIESLVGAFDSGTLEELIPSLIDYVLDRKEKNKNLGKMTEVNNESISEAATEIFDAIADDGVDYYANYDLILKDWTDAEIQELIRIIEIQKEK